MNKSLLVLLPLLFFFLSSAMALGSNEDCNDALERATGVLPVVIIGGGPAGLSIAYELGHRGIPSVILERGLRAGHSWHEMPTHLSLLSHWKTNILPGTPSDDPVRGQKTTRKSFAQYLERYAGVNALNIILGAEVRGIEKRPDEIFTIAVGEHVLKAKVVVNATGYFSNPYTPHYAGCETTRIPQMHVASYKNAEQIAQIRGSTNQRILIVGKRLSAGQVMVELKNAGFDVSISHRSPITFGPEPRLSRLFYDALPGIESLATMIPGLAPRSLEPRMEGGPARDLITTGQVKVLGDIHHFEANAVVFKNGLSLEFDQVIYATGYRPALQHLGQMISNVDGKGRPLLKDMESTQVPGLFFLGLEGQGDFRSRFIRGIRDDAPVVATRIQRRLAL